MYEHGNMNIEQQEGTYDWFIWLFKWGTIVSAAIAALVVFLLT